MTARTAAIGLVVCLLAILLVRAFGNYATCYVSLFFSPFALSVPNELLRAECFEQTIGFLFFFFR